jgi:hypothetical protein
MGNNLALKVEGVIDQKFSGDKGEGAKTSRKYFRKPKAIRITVVATPTPATNQRMHAHGMELNKVRFEQKHS